MMNKNTAENSIKVIELPFEVVAVTQNNMSQILDTRSNTVSEPVNIKVKVRNKAEKTGGHGVISVPKLKLTRSKKVRLVSSDQTIISFNLLMETDNVKKVPKKGHFKILDIFKPSGCFNIQNDDDINPYVPSSSNEIHWRKSTSNIDDRHDNNEQLEENFGLKKILPPMKSGNTALRTPTIFLGKCKPGGCLDPPFSEEKYIYKPRSKILSIDNINVETKSLNEDNNVKCISNTDTVIDKLSSPLEHLSSKNSGDESYSHSLITYPPDLSFSEVRIREENQSKKSKTRTSTDTKDRTSVNEFSETYFMPPKQKSINNEIPENETQKKTSYIFELESNYLEQHKEITPIPPISSEQRLFEQTPQDSQILRYTDINAIQFENRKNSSNDLLQGYKNTNLGELPTKVSKSKLPISKDVSVSDINFNGNTSKNKMDVLINPHTDIITSDITKKPFSESKITDVNTNQGNQKYSEDVTRTINDFQQQNEIMGNLKRLDSLSNVSTGNYTLLNQEQSKLKLQTENLTTISNDLLTESELKLRHLKPLDDTTDINSNIGAIDNLSETDNVSQITYTEKIKLENKGSKHSSQSLDILQDGNDDTYSIGSFIQIKSESNSNRSPLSSKEQTEEEIIMHQQQLLHNRQSRDVIASRVFNTEKNGRTHDVFEIEDTDEIKNNNVGLSDSTLDNVNNEPIDDKTLKKNSTNFTEYLETLSTELNLNDEENSFISANLKSDSNAQNSLPILQEKITSILQSHDLTYDENIINKNNLTTGISPTLPNSSNVSHRTVISAATLIDNTSGNVLSTNILNIGQNQSLVNINLNNLRSLSSKEEKLVELKSQLSLTNSKILLDNSQINQDSTVDSYLTFSGKENNVKLSEPLLKEFPDLRHDLIKVETSNINALDLEGTELNDKNNLKIIGLQNTRSSLIQINLGFYTDITEKNETIIKTVDTSKQFEAYPQDKITVVKTIIRKNDSEIRIPINSKMDLTFQIKRSYNFSKGTSQNSENLEITSMTKPTKYSVNKDVLLQETLNSVYEHLVPIEKIMRNLKHEADLLNQQQVLFKEALNNAKIKPVKLIRANTKCTCYKI